LEDLTMHDPDSDQQWVLVVVHVRENNYDVFRRRYTSGGIADSAPARSGD